MTDRMAQLERVADAGAVVERVVNEGVWDTQEGADAFNAMEDALRELRALSSHTPEPPGEVVEVRAAVLVNADGAPSLCDMTSSGQFTQRALNSWLRNGFQHIATITARVPLPTIPTVAARIET